MDIRPGVSGVGDYALNIARALNDNYGIYSLFMIPRTVTDISVSVGGFPVIGLEKRDSKNLTSVLESKMGATGQVLLHYSGYGYDKNGIPRWLIDGLRDWKRRDSRRKLVTVFHELYAIAWPWRRAFWFSRRQKDLGKQLAQLSDSCTTSRHGSAALIRQWRGLGVPAATVRIAAIPSGVGEPSRVSPLSNRRAAMAVFGSLANRERAYGQAGSLLERACEMLGLREIVDIGPGEPRYPPLPPSIQLRTLGMLPPEEVGRVLLECRAGLLHYLPSRLTKSSIFGAYCAHGVVPVVPANDSGEEDGIVAGRNYWFPSLGEFHLNQMQVISREVRSWYARNSIRAAADNIAHLLDR